jgi:putative DNA primase/helicase
MAIKKFLSAFYGENDDVCIRVFSDRKAEDPEFKGQKYTDKLSNIENIMPMLKQHNEKHRGVFFVVNGGGHTDEEITTVNAQFVEMDTGSFEEQQAKIDAFKLPPSIIVKTRKSLHCYWLIKNGDIKDRR